MPDKTPDAPTFVTTQGHAAADPFRLLVESVKDYGIYMLDPAGRVSSWNPGAEKIEGYKAEEIIGEHFSRFYPPDIVAAGGPQRGLQIALRAGRFEEEGTRIRKGGEAFEAVVTITDIRDSFERHIGFAVVTRDITERKRAEEALREKEAELAEAVRLARVGYWSRDLATDRLRWSDKLHDIFGTTPDTFAPSYESFLTLVHPDDRRGVEERIALAVAGSGSFDHTYRIPVGGDLRTIHEVGRVVPSADGHPRRVVGSTQDISERKNAEGAIRTSDERFRAFMDNSPATAFIKDERGRYLYVNPTWLQQFGGEPIDWHGKTDHDLWPQDTADLFRASDVECLAGGVAVQKEETSRTPVGKNATFLTMKFPLIEGEHRLVGGMAWDISERRQAEGDLLLRDRAIASLVQGLCITDCTRPDNPIVYVNPSFLKLTGYEYHEVIGRNCRFLQGPDTAPEAVERVRAAVRQEQSCLVEFLNYRRDGSRFWNGLSISPIRNRAGRVTHFVGVQTDISPSKLMERQFHQSQKMEAIGQLAGGVAHDFNNLLTIISGYSELVLDSLPADDPNRESVEEINHAGERAAGLTRQLLLFSRRALLELKVIELNGVIREAEKLLRRTIGEDIRVATLLDPGIGRVRVDPGQIGQVLMNLAINSRDAMQQGGKLTIETANVRLDEAYAAEHSDCRPGLYVMLAVSDNGAGMTPEVRDRAFEPFFTTKGPGKGTGLGLATVYGIVRQSGGSIYLYSEPGLGTTFKIYLPVVEDPLQPASDPRPQKATTGSETILLVEDEEAVRTIARIALENRGYEVLQASGGPQALEFADRHRGRIDLLVTDLVMPGMSGGELAKTLTQLYPKLKVLYQSGYTEDTVVRHGILLSQVAFLQKPYTPQSLALKVRELLDQ